MPNSTDAVTPESAVRLYLMFLDDPATLVDDEVVKELEAKVDAGGDPIERLRTLAQLERAKAADESAYKYDFIKHAKSWADSEGVRVSAFREMDVPEDVLRAAGLVPGASRRRGRTATTKDVDASRPRRTRSNPEDLREGILALEGQFSVRNVTEAVGGSAVTIKNLIGQLEAQGKVKAAGEKAGNRGRAAKVWEVVAD
jgi:hypothetical protein